MSPIIRIPIGLLRFTFLLILISIPMFMFGQSEELRRYLPLPETRSLPDGWRILFQSQLTISDLSQITRIRSEVYLELGFQEAWQQFLQTPSGTAKIFIEGYKDSSKMKSLFDLEKKLLETQNVSYREYTSFGDMGVRTEIAGFQEILAVEGRFFITLIAAGEGDVETLARLIFQTSPHDAARPPVPSEEGGRQTVPPDKKPQLPIRLEFSAPDQVQIESAVMQNLSFTLNNQGRPLSGIRIEVRPQQLDQLSVQGERFFTLPTFPAGNAYSGSVRLLPKILSGRTRVFILVNDSDGRQIAKHHVDFVVKPQQKHEPVTDSGSSIPHQSSAQEPSSTGPQQHRYGPTFLGVYAAPISMALEEGEAGKINLNIKNEGLADAMVIFLSARVDTPSIADIETGIPPGASFNIVKGGSRTLEVSLKALHSGSLALRFEVKGVNTDLSESVVDVKIHRRFEKPGNHSEIDNLFDSRTGDKVRFRLMDRDEKYRWISGRLSYGNCRWIPLYGPSCDESITPRRVVYVLPDLTRRNPALDSLYKIFSGLDSSRRAASANVAKGILNTAANWSDIVSLYTTAGNIESTGAGKAKETEIEYVAGLFLGPLVDLYNLSDDLAERNRALNRLESFFPGARFGYIRHHVRQGGEWTELTQYAFFTESTEEQGTWYVYVLPGALQ